MLQQYGVDQDFSLLLDSKFSFFCTLSFLCSIFAGNEIGNNENYGD